MHHDLGDVLRILEANVRPRFSAVHGLVHSVAIRNISANARFARAHVHHIRIGRRHGHRANGHDSGLVCHRHPCQPTVFRLPHAARHGSEIISSRITRHAGHGQRAPAAKWPNLPPFHALQRLVIQGLRMNRFLPRPQRPHRQQKRGVNRQSL